MIKLKKKCNGILYEGGYDNFSVNSGLMNIDRPQLERSKRIGMAYLLATNPETFEILAKNNINLFHGTNSNALPNILNYGINSVDESLKKDINVSTGEKWSRIDGERNFISFTDNLNTAMDYSTIPSSKDEKKKNSFGILIGISSNDIEQLRTCKVDSDTPEIGIKNNVPLEYIKCIAVPEDKVNFVRKLVNTEQIMVVPININDRFYYIDDWMIEFNSELVNSIIEKQNQAKTAKTFDSEEVKELAHERRKSGILNIYQKIKEKINIRGKNKENDSREK